MHDLRDLAAFVEVVRLGSFSAAARRLQVTPSAISKGVARLERALDARLFNRTTRQLQPTAEGRLFFDRMAGALAGVDEAVEALKAVQGGVAGPIRISTIVSFGKHFILPAVPDFQARYPQVQIEIQFDDGLPDLVRDGFDLAIRRAPIKQSGATVRRLCALPLILVASPDYLARRGTPESPADLASHECVSIRFPSGRLAKWVFRREGESEAVHLPQGRLIVSEQPADMLVDAALMGAGVTAIAVCFVTAHLASGALRLVLPGWGWERPSEIFIQYPHRRHMPLRVKAFSDFLSDRLHADPRIRPDAAGCDGW